MKNKLNIYYDKKGDFLEVTSGKLLKSYVKDIGEGIFERIEEKSGKIVGFGIIGFSKKRNIALPLDMKLEG